ncbi:deoxyribodipyrimidine photo-lyase [Paenibacillus sp. S-38]|uniref:deoxyribodipyrimidine photo-lyase n=1 Tax=Paenibacillus sp. S-38 TaxID=3416710 RepID=UPI003CE85AC2
MILFLHRKDLRTADLPAFDYIHACGSPSLHVLVLDPFLLRRDRHREHSGRSFLARAARLQSLYAAQGQRLHLLCGEPASVVGALLEAHAIRELVFHEDHTPYALTRDRLLREAAAPRGVRVTALDEQALADLRDFHRHAGRSEPYKVFTPYYRRCASTCGSISARPPLLPWAGCRPCRWRRASRSVSRCRGNWRRRWTPAGYSRRAANRKRRWRTFSASGCPATRRGATGSTAGRPAVSQGT